MQRGGWRGSVTDRNTYDADGHVVGPTNNRTTTSLTLGNTEHAVSASLPAAPKAWTPYRQRRLLPYLVRLEVEHGQHYLHTLSWFVSRG